jgi:hypothetical protein
MRGSTVRAPIYAPVIDPGYAYVLVTVAYRTLGYASPPVLLPTYIAKALLYLHWRSLG